MTGFGTTGDGEMVCDEFAVGVEPGVRCRILMFLKVRYGIVEDDRPLEPALRIIHQTFSPM